MKSRAKRRLTNRQMKAQAKRFELAIRWTLGELGEFPGRERAPDEGNWWWRDELVRRAGLRWDAKRMKYVPREYFQQNERRP